MAKVVYAVATGHFRQVLTTLRRRLAATCAMLVLAAAACTATQSETQTTMGGEEIMATLEALPPAATVSPEELAMQRETQALVEKWLDETSAQLEDEYGSLLATPTPDPRYKGCHDEVQAYHAATLGRAATTEERYFEALAVLGTCLARTE